MGLNCRRGHDVPKYKILFVHASFVLATFVLISNISAVTDPILANFQSQLSGTILSRCQLSWWNLSMQHLSWRHLSLSAISQLLVVRFLTNFEGMFLGPFRTYPNCHNEICPGNISPCNICPYPEYLSYYWIDFDKALKVGSWELIEHILTVKMTFVQATYVSWWYSSI